jgi:hypothetical protein
MNGSSWLAIVATLLLISLLLVARKAYELLRYTEEKRIDLEAQRHMLRFCKNPTRRNWEAAWDFITDHEVKLGGLNWPLVERFTKTAVATNFPLDAQPS